jgi:hypothetical protein
MQRRSFLRVISLVTASFATYNLAQLSKLGSTPTYRQITIYFPPGKSFTTFQAEMNSWMNLEKWKLYLAEIQKSGTLLKMTRKVYSDHVVYGYQFNDSQSLVEFQKAAISICEANVKMRAELGYSEKIVHS